MKLTIWTFVATVWAICWIIIALFFGNVMIKTDTTTLNGIAAFGLSLIGFCVSLAVAASGAKDIADIANPNTK
jgi:hypothetical protein